MSHYNSWPNSHVRFPLCLVTALSWLVLWLVLSHLENNKRKTIHQRVPEQFTNWLTAVVLKSSKSNWCMLMDETKVPQATKTSTNVYTRVLRILVLWSSTASVHRAVIHLVRFHVHTNRLHAVLSSDGKSKSKSTPTLRII